MLGSIGGDEDTDRFSVVQVYFEEAQRHKGRGCGAGAQDFHPAERMRGPASAAADC